MASITQFYKNTPSDYTDTEDYRVYIESMIGILQRSEATRTIAVSPEHGYVFRSDLTSFLLDNQVPIEDHYVVLRMNGFLGVQDFNEHVQSLLIPDQQELHRYKQLYRTKLKK